MPTDRYSRQEALREIGPEGQRRLARSRVLVVGVGGLGSPLATYLAAAGVGTLGLVDGDGVSLSNLQRQTLYTEAEVGLSKALCAQRRLHAINSEIDIRAYPLMLTQENAEELVAQYDIVADGCDNYATRRLMSRVCLSLGKPYVYAAIEELEGQVAILCHPLRLRAYECLNPEPTAETELRPSRAVVGVTPAVVGSVEAGEVLKLICGYGEPLIGRLWTIDLRTLQSYILDIPPLCD